MKNKLVSAITLTLLLMSMVTLAFHVQPVQTERSRLTIPEESAASQATMNLAGQEPPPTEWNKTYPRPGWWDEAWSLIQTADGGYAIAGRTKYAYLLYTDAWLMKTDSAGNTQWSKEYGRTDYDGRAYSMVQTADGGYAIAGCAWGSSSSGTDFWLVKTDSLGNAQWNKTYGGTYDDVAYSLVQAADGGYVLVGYFGRSSGQKAMIFMKVDSTGRTQYSHTLSGGDALESFAYSVVRTVDGGYALAGYTRYSEGLCYADLIKIDSAGNTQWGNEYSGHGWESFAYSVVQTADGGYALAGSAGQGDNHFVWLVKTDSAGNEQWNRGYGGTGNDWARSVVQTADGGYAIAGRTESFGAGSGDCWLVKTDSLGNAQWNMTYGGTKDDGARSVVQTADGGYALAGYKDSIGSYSGRVWLIKVGVQAGFATVKIVGSAISLNPEYVVNAVLNVTMLSAYANSIGITCCLILVDTRGQEVYDNFAGIGGPQDDKSTLAQNNTITTVQFTFQLQEPRPGKYACTISIWSYDKGKMYDSSDWIPAFDIHSWPVYFRDLGTLYANSYLQDNPVILLLKRFESINYTFRLANNVTDLSVKVFTFPNSQFRCTLNASDVEMSIEGGEIFPDYNITHNVPANTYEMNLELISAVTNVIRVVIRAGPSFEVPSVQIMEVAPTGDFATPGGTMNYKVDVGFNVTTYDTLVLNASLGGQIQDTRTYGIEPFKSSEITVYLKVNASSEVGQYTVDFNASILTRGIFNNVSTILSVVYATYNITVSPTVKYYQEKLGWSFRGEKEYVDDPTKLSALDVTNIMISSVDKRDPQTQKPTMASISFYAADKKTDVHYVVYVKIGSSVYQLGAVIGGDKPRRIEAHHIPVVNDKASFTILYRKWTLGNWFVQVGIQAVSAVIESTLSLAAINPGRIFADELVTSLVTYTMLYTLQTWMDRESAYMTIDDATRIIENSGVQQSVFVPYLVAAVGVNCNPFYGFLAAVDYLHDSGKMSGWNWARAYIAAIGHILGKASSKLLDVMSDAFIWSVAKLGITDVIVEVVKSKMHEVLNPTCVLGKVNGLVDGARAIWNALMILLSPSEEGKEVSDAQIGTEPAVEVDPVVSISFEGQVDYTNETCFGDILNMNFSLNQTEAQMILEVDPNLTATYLAMFSNPVCRLGILSCLGFNATQTNAEWRSEDSTFVLGATGSPYEGLNYLRFWMNSSYIQGTQTMSTEASLMEDTAWLNGTLSYPFGRELNYSISVVLPQSSQIITVQPSENCTIEGSTLTWNCTVDTIAIQFETRHNVAVIACNASKNIIGQGFTALLNMTIRNQGDFPEVLNASFYANEMEIKAFLNIALNSGESVTLAFVWSTSALAYGNYTIKAVADILPDETHTSDNTCIFGTVRVGIPGDVDPTDGYVGIDDIFATASHFSQDPSSPHWNPNLDINGDDYVGIDDIFTAAQHFGQEENP
jgi:hypothetical protein